MKEQLPSNPLHYPGDSTYEHARRLKLESNFPRPKSDLDNNPTKKLREEIALTSSFGIPLEDFGELAKGLFGEEVGIDSLNEEQNAQIQGAYLGFYTGWKSGLEQFFRNRKADTQE